MLFPNLKKSWMQVGCIESASTLTGPSGEGGEKKNAVLATMLITIIVAMNTAGYSIPTAV